MKFKEGVTSFNSKLVKLFEYEVGDITGKDPMQKHEFWDNNHKKMIMSKVPKISCMNAKEIEGFIKIGKLIVPKKKKN